MVTLSRDRWTEGVDRRTQGRDDGFSSAVEKMAGLRKDCLPGGTSLLSQGRAP